MKLYDLSQNYNNLIELLDNADVPQDVIRLSLNEISEEFETKAENIAKLIKNIESDICSFKAEEKRINERRKILENRVKSLKEYLTNNMLLCDKTKFEKGTFKFAISKNAPSLNIVDENKIAKKWYLKQDPVLNRREILEALKTGVKVKGVELIQTESLRIR